MAWNDSQILSAISYYYGTNSSLWDKIKTNNATFEEIQAAYNAIPRVQTVSALDGSTLGIDVTTRFAEPPSIVDDIIGSADSGAAGSSYGGNNGSLTGNIPSNFGGGGGSDYTVSSGAISGSGSTLQKVFAVADKLSLAVTGVNIGAKLGMKIDETLYNLNPEWWNEHFPTINPQTWASIASEDENGQKFIRSLFGIKDDKLTPYVTDDAIAYVYQMLRDTGALSPSSGYTYEGETSSFPYPDINSIIYTTSYIDDRGRLFSVTPGDLLVITPASATGYYEVCGLSRFPNHWIYRDGNEYRDISLHYNTFVTVNGNPYYTSVAWATTMTGVPTLTFPYNFSNPQSLILKQIATIFIDGNAYGPTQGIEPMPDTPYGIPDPSIISGTDIPTIKQQLKQNYPDLFTDPITSTVMQPDGTLKTYDYYPIPWATDGTQTETQPTTKTETQTETTIKPETVPQLFPETQETLDTPPTTPPPDTGTGDTPESVIPIVEPTSLWAIYNPSSSEVNSFGAWLWSSNFIDNILKLFANPMQAIISLHKIYCTPSRGTRRNIIVGYLDSGVSSDTVNRQYVSFSCGTVSLKEYFGNVFDYSPFTSIHIYLPFIGIYQLNVADAMRGSIEVEYTVDVFTGACTSKVNITRDGSGGTIYEWAGNAAVFYPVSSGDYTGVVRGIMGAALSGLSGNVPGAIGSLMSSGVNVQRSGSFSGNAGAMNLRKPYLIISRPMPKLAENFNHFVGYPSNKTVRIGDCEGFIKMRAHHIKISNATDDELNEIENFLYRGVIV